MDKFIPEYKLISKSFSDKDFSASKILDLIKQLEYSINEKQKYVIDLEIENTDLRGTKKLLQKEFE